MPERVGASTQTDIEMAIEREKDSMVNVLSVINDTSLFPFFYGAQPTVPNGSWDSNQIDIVAHTHGALALDIGLGYVSFQVKSAWHDLNWFMGYLQRNGAGGRREMKFLHHTAQNWVASRLILLNGQEDSDIITADIALQLAAICGRWPNGWQEFVGRYCSPKTLNITEQSYDAIYQHQESFLQWINKGVKKLAPQLEYA